MSTIKLMLADDQELIRESLAFVLNTDTQLNVIALARNGKQAIELCEKELPDVILMDIQMPEMNGIEATRLIKQRWPHVRIIILTTFQEIDHVLETLTIGAEGYLLKAIHPNDLIAGIKLIHRGGTLLPNDIAKQLIQQLNNPTEKIVSSPASRYSLTVREEQVLKNLAMGLSNKLIAEKLNLSEGTVKNYISSIYHKLDVNDRLHAVNKAKKEDLV
ncbi:DNA-binding response regulator [Bacillus sp. M6-12]|uniref:response regulator transcription factor n=1 Tax=Bacillus sp. M6-12 TaxID=2054166 RepID=UPI000C76AB74|nr:response regulator transcription factor [Bacillus sp. M6-12]PLS16177.1 DNA-binding response regulator [Bacillus sp. M6-12]